MHLTKRAERLREKLATALPADKLNHVYNSFDVVGDIAIIKVHPENQANAEAIAKQIMATHKKLKAVFAKASPIVGDFRVRELQLLAGENRTSTRCRESGCVFSVDVEKCYFSPRLSGERLRIARLVEPKETVVNMFAGVGCFSVMIAKKVSETKVHSIDINPVAYQYMQENVELNNLQGRVFPMLGDAKDIVKGQLQGIADRVLMPLPEKALEYLPYAVSALKKTGGYIHYFDFQHATARKEPTEKTKQKVAQALDCLGLNYSFSYSRIIRPTGPNWFQTVLDLHVF
jgi:tRNA (guanine37-N1)-methyltransferase